MEGTDDSIDYNIEAIIKLPPGSASIFRRIDCSHELSFLSLAINI